MFDLLISKINSKLLRSPLIFFSREIERAIGLLDYLNNFYICVIENHYIVDKIKEKFGEEKVFCAETEIENFYKKSSLELIKHPKTQEWIKKISKKGQFYAQFFQFNKPVELIVSNLGGILLNNPSAINRYYESKINQHSILKKISSPQSEIVSINTTNYQKLFSKYNQFVIQLDLSHTGGGTFFVKNIFDFNDFLKKYNGNTVKISKFISGESYTINGSIYKNQVYISGIQYQITGIKELTNNAGTTVGNDWSFGYESLSEGDREKINEEVTKIGKILIQKKYKGMFGVDLIVKNGIPYIIEINARQTANIPLQTALEIEKDLIPLSALHLAEFLNLDIDLKPSPLQRLTGAQIFLRNKYKSVKIKKDFENGIYNLNLEKTKDDFKFEKLEKKEIIILTVKKNQEKKENEELARIQSRTSIVNNFETSKEYIDTLTLLEHNLLN